MPRHNMHPHAQQRIAPWREGGAPPAGVLWMPTSLTINSVTEEAAVVFRGDAATVSAWPAAVGTGDMEIVGSGADVVPGQATGFALAPTGVRFDEGKYFRSVSTALGDVTTQDFVIEAVLLEAGGASGVQYAVGKGSPGSYWQIRNTAAGQLRFYTVGAGGSAVSAAQTVSAATWLHLMWFYDASGSYQAYVNGVALGSAVACSTVGSLTNTDRLTFGARPTAGDFPWDGRLALLQQWVRASWLDTHLQAAVAAARYALLTG